MKSSDVHLAAHVLELELELDFVGVVATSQRGIINHANK